MVSKINKKDGKLKKRYHDLPRFPVIYKYEGDFKAGFEKTLNAMTKEIANRLKKMKK